MSPPGRSQGLTPERFERGGTPESAPGEGSACSGSEVFALRVLGEDMAPEFRDGEIIVVEPGGAVKDGSYVLANLAGEWIFRQLRRDDAGAWWLRATNPACRERAAERLADLSAVHGVIIQKAVPGRRKLSRSYI